MRWDDFRRSDNIEDDRDGGGIGLPGGVGLPAGPVGIGTVLVLGLLGWALGIDPGVLGNTEDVWTQIFQEAGRVYRPPRLRLYAGSEPGGCGFANAAMGPFYCPRDRRIYLDTSFFRDLQIRFRGCSGKACEFAQAYVIAHEVGHHVQNLLGVLAKVEAAQHAAASRAAANRLQVRVELQADCFAGIWAHHSDARWRSIEPGDVAAALQTAAAIGDDRLQRRTQGYVVPDAFTHGTSEQRQRWFSIGLRQGTVAACDTLSAASL